MATSSAQRTKRDPRTGQPILVEDDITRADDPAPLGTVERPGERLAATDTTDTGNTTSSSYRGISPEREGRGFGTTFAIAAAVLVVAFLIAMYLGSGSDNRTAVDTQAPVTEQAPAPTGSTTEAPATGTTQQDTSGTAGNTNSTGTTTGTTSTGTSSGSNSTGTTGTTTTP
jgi:hypothetical protein